MESFDLALMLLRGILGVVMLAHGIKHARGRIKTTKWFGSIGFRMPALQWLASTATEIGVGVLLIVGLGTSLASAGLIGIMTVAFMSVHRRAGFWITARPDEGYEYVLVLAVASATVAMVGPGAWSLDGQLDIADRLDGWIGLALAGAGVLVAFLQLALFFRPSPGRK
jgi:putative oxidoreductase